MMVEQPKFDKFKIVKQMLDAGQNYNLVVATVAQLWELTPRVAEQQMTAAGYGRQKYAKIKKAEEAPKPETKEQPQEPAPKKKRSAPKSRVSWNSELDSRLATMWAEGAPARDIAKSLGATVDAVNLTYARVASQEEDRACSQAIHRA